MPLFRFSSVWFASDADRVHFVERRSDLKAYFYSLHSFFQRYARILILIFLTFFIFFIGIRSSLSVDDCLFPLVREAFACPVSTVRLIYLSELPFLAAVLAVLYAKPLWLIPLCGIKAFCFSFTVGTVYFAYGIGGWLAVPFVMGPSIFGFLVMMRFCIRHVSGFRKNAGAELGISMAFVAGISLLDCNFIAPFWRAVMNV